LAFQSSANFLGDFVGTINGCSTPKTTISDVTTVFGHMTLGSKDICVLCHLVTYFLSFVKPLPYRTKHEM
jgi:hypothetical protein